MSSDPQSVALKRQQVLEQEDRISRERLLIAEMETSGLHDKLLEAHALLRQMEAAGANEDRACGGYARVKRANGATDEDVMAKVIRDCPL